MRTTLFKSASDFAVLPPGCRRLSVAEIELVTGGDDGDDGVPSLGDVTVSAVADAVSGGQGDAAAEQMVNAIDLAMTDSAAALAMFGIVTFQALMEFAASHPTPPTGNPMGDPTGGYVPAGGP